MGTRQKYKWELLKTIDTSNMTIREIQDFLHCKCYDQVWRHCKTNNIPFTVRKHKKPADRIDYSKVDWENKYISELANELHVSRSALYDYSRTHGIQIKRKIAEKASKTVTDEETYKKIAALDWEHKTISELCKEVNVSRGVLYGYAVRHNIEIQFTRGNKTLFKLLKPHHDSSIDMSIPEISKLTGSSYHACFAYCKRHNITTKPDKIIKALMELLRPYSNSSIDMTIAEMCAKTGASYCACFKYCKRHNITFKKVT